VSRQKPGGDGAGSFNISHRVAFVAAACVASVASTAIRKCSGKGWAPPTCSNASVSTLKSSAQLR